jgi:quercetin dioxygenase-like cupin family protein
MHPLLAHAWDAIELEQTNPHFARRVVHTERMTIARIVMKQGGIVPEHHHENEQVTVLVSGRLRFIAEGVTKEIGAGEVMQIRPNVVHRVEALEDSEAYDLFAPVRADWLAGDDAYLRQTETK